MSGPARATGDPAAFIRANTRLSAPRLIPEIVLHQADRLLPLWRATEPDLEALGLPPPFWAFAWAGGQALARYVLDHRDFVRGKTVLDLASGSGLVGIAAMQAGARAALAADIDRFAADAAQLNAALNGVTLQTTDADLIGAEAAQEVILVGDLFYDRDLAPRVFDWLLTLRAAGKSVLIGDPGRTYLPKHKLIQIAAYDIPVTRALEDAELKRAAVWELRYPSSPRTARRRAHPGANAHRRRPRSRTEPPAHPPRPAARPGSQAKARPPSAR